jgi:hypothetical protein
MKPDERLEALLEEHARSYNEPDAIPREAIWERIQESRRARRVTPLSRRRPWVQSVAAAAALVVLGIAIGRYSAHRPSGGAVTDRVAAVPEAARPEAAPTPYRVAAAEHFGRAEILLTQLDNASRADDEVFGWARSLLANTRLLLNSPAGLQPEYRELLVDLELVLAQLVYAAGRQSQEERLWVAEGMEQRDVLQRLRMLRPASAGT